MGPLEAYYEQKGKPCVVHARLKDLRWFGASGLSYGRDSLHPYVRTIIEYESGRCHSYRGSFLEKYWRAWTPTSLAEYFGLDPTSCHPLLLSTPPIHNILPWSPIDRVEYMEEQQWLDRSDYRALCEAGYPPARSCGPKPEWFGEARYAQITDVYERIQEEGYREDAPDALPYGEQHIVGNCLVRGDEVRIVVANGQHRASALSALGYEEAPLIVHCLNYRGPSIVRRRDVDLWPLVRLGIFSKREALSIFDRIFDAQPPEEVRSLASSASA